MMRWNNNENNCYYLQTNCFTWWCIFCNFMLHSNLYQRKSTNNQRQRNYLLSLSNHILVFIWSLFSRKIKRKLAQTLTFSVPSNYFPLKVWNLWQDLYDWITIKRNEYSFLFLTVSILLGYFLVTLACKFPYKDLYKIRMYYCHLGKLCLRKRVLTK